MNSSQTTTKYICPVCFYPEMDGPPKDFNVCPCCGVEFEYDDSGNTHEQLRQVWIEGGKKWWFRDAPEGWNADEQLIKAGFIEH